MTGIDPGTWPEVAQRIGLGGAVVLVFAIGIASGLAVRGPEWVRALNEVLSTILTHRRESRRIKEAVKRERDALSLEFKKQGIPQLEAPQGFEP